MLAKLGIPVTCTDIFGTWGNTWLDGLDLPQPYAGKVASLRQLNAELSTEITLPASRSSATCWPGTRDTVRSGRCRASARCWPR